MVVSLFFPMRCKLCGTDLPKGARILCTDCLIHGDYFLRDRFEIVGANDADAALVYQDFIRTAMHAYKFQYHRAYADWFAALTGDCLAGWLDIWRPEVITFVPLSFSRWMGRGYNQSALVARLMAKRFQLPCQSFLRKRWNVKTQSHVPHEYRRQNAERAFRFRYSSNVTGARVLLVDDVVTTGATAAACVRILKEQGASAVFVLGITKTPLVSRK